MTGHEVTDRLIHALAERITRKIDGDWMGEETIAEVIAEGIAAECDRDDGTLARRLPAVFAGCTSGASERLI